MKKVGGKKKDQCKQGLSCGVACISRKKVCRKTMSSQQAKELAGRFSKAIRSSQAATRGGGGGTAGSGQKIKSGKGSDVLNSSMSKQQGDIVRAAEKKIRNNPFETGALIDSKGKLAWNRKGGEDSVDLTGLDKVSRDVRRESVMTHNHPPQKVPSTGEDLLGGSFSVNDVLAAAAFELKGMRATDKKYTYSLKVPQDENWNSMSNQELIHNAEFSIWKDKKADANARAEKRYDSEGARGNQEKMDKILYEERVEAQHETMKQLADEFGFEYSRTEHGE